MIKQVEDAIIDEDRRCNAYLPPTTRIVVLNKVREVFLEKHYAAIINKEGSGLFSLLAGIFSDTGAEITARTRELVRLLTVLNTFSCIYFLRGVFAGV